MFIQLSTIQKQKETNTIPSNRGDMDHTTNGLFPVNCPKETSKKYRGTPEENSRRKKGIKKAPGNHRFMRTYWFSPKCHNNKSFQNKSYRNHQM